MTLNERVDDIRRGMYGGNITYLYDAASIISNVVCGFGKNSINGKIVKAIKVSRKGVGIETEVKLKVLYEDKNEDGTNVSDVINCNENGILMDSYIKAVPNDDNDTSEISKYELVKFDYPDTIDNIYLLEYLTNRYEERMTTSDHFPRLVITSEDSYVKGFIASTEVDVSKKHLSYNNDKDYIYLVDIEEVEKYNNAHMLNKFDRFNVKTKIAFDPATGKMLNFIARRVDEEARDGSKRPHYYKLVFCNQEDNR